MYRDCMRSLRKCFGVKTLYHAKTVARARWRHYRVVPRFAAVYETHDPTQFFVSPPPQILIKLAVEEPGPNWANETYTHARGVPNIWGWLLPESWTREDEDMHGDGGPRRMGILCLCYITDPVRPYSPLPLNEIFLQHAFLARRHETRSDSVFCTLFCCNVQPRNMYLCS